MATPSAAPSHDPPAKGYSVLELCNAKRETPEIYRAMVLQKYPSAVFIMVDSGNRFIPVNGSMFATTSQYIRKALNTSLFAEYYTRILDLGDFSHTVFIVFRNWVEEHSLEIQEAIRRSKSASEGFEDSRELREILTMTESLSTHLERGFRHAQAKNATNSDFTEPHNRDEYLEFLFEVYKFADYIASPIFLNEISDRIVSQLKVYHGNYGGEKPLYLFDKVWDASAPWSPIRRIFLDVLDIRANDEILQEDLESGIITSCSLLKDLAVKAIDGSSLLGPPWKAVSFGGSCHYHWHPNNCDRVNCKSAPDICLDVEASSVDEVNNYSNTSQTPEEVDSEDSSHELSIPSFVNGAQNTIYSSFDELSSNTSISNPSGSNPEDQTNLYDQAELPSGQNNGIDEKSPAVELSCMEAVSPADQIARNILLEEYRQWISDALDGKVSTKDVCAELLRTGDLSFRVPEDCPEMSKSRSWLLELLVEFLDLAHHIGIPVLMNAIIDEIIIELELYYNAHDGPPMYLFEFTWLNTERDNPIRRVLLDSLFRSRWTEVYNPHLKIERLLDSGEINALEVLKDIAVRSLQGLQPAPWKVNECMYHFHREVPDGPNSPACRHSWGLTRKNKHLVLESPLTITDDEPQEPYFHPDNVQW